MKPEDACYRDGTPSPKFSCVSRKNRVMSFYVLFRRNLIAKATERFYHSKTGDRILIDCSEDDFPIGLQVIFCKSLKEQSFSTDDAPNELIHCLFLAATELISEDNNRDKDELIETIVRYIQRIPLDTVEVERI